MNVSGFLLGIGNPLLDATMVVDDAYLSKFSVKPGTATLAKEWHKQIFDDLLVKAGVDYGAGGCALNTIRAANWMMQKPSSCTYVGTVGNDKGAKLLKDYLTKEGVSQHFLTHTNLPTGTCAVLVRESERTLVTNLAAAGVFSDQDFMCSDVYQSMLNARMYYTTGFFLNVHPKTLVDLGLCALTPGKKFFFNLAAPFIIEMYWEKIIDVLKFVDAVFCNNFEAETVGKVSSWGKNLDVIAEKLGQLPIAEGKGSRIVVITCGSDDTVVYFDGKLYHIPPLPIPRSEIVDTNGAGDSFVGGFIAEYVKHGMNGREIDEEKMFRCIASAHYCAMKVLSKVGCRFSGTPCVDIDAISRGYALANPRKDELVQDRIAMLQD